MARKTKKENIHQFTRQIHSSKRRNTRFFNMNNHNEKKAKELNELTCKECRYFDGCHVYIGKYHKICDIFEWD